jgi:hypothetical protein
VELHQQVKEDKDSTKIKKKWIIIKKINNKRKVLEIWKDKQAMKVAKNNKSKMLKMMDKPMKINDHILT